MLLTPLACNRIGELATGCVRTRSPMRCLCLSPGRPRRVEHFQFKCGELSNLDAAQVADLRAERDRGRPSGLFFSLLESVQVIQL